MHKSKRQADAAAAAPAPSLLADFSTLFDSRYFNVLHNGWGRFGLGCGLTVTHRELSIRLLLGWFGVRIGGGIA
jgi:hypothetical protein